MMDAVKKGGNRQELHERIRELSMEAGRNVKVEGRDNNLLELIAADPAFGMTLEELQETMEPARYIGRSKEQVDAFRQQIEWAAEAGLPLAIHSRNAFDELYSVMDENRAKGLTGVFHCFSGSEDEARKLLSFDGFYLGIGGVVTYRKSLLPAVLASVPLERIVLETDSPYLPPVPYRGRRNESSYVPRIAEFLSGVYGCSIEEVAEVTTANALRLFPKLNV
jgi:TatD family hydrolase